MKTDTTLRQDVLDELGWEPSLDASKIGVTVKNGIVTLSGTVSTYSEKITAEKAASQVQGVKAVAVDLEVETTGELRRTDSDIAQAALNSLKWNTNIPEDKIRVKVEDGWVTLNGNVNWKYQAQEAKDAVKNLVGVRGITNMIQVQEAVPPEDVKSKIRKAFERNAEIDADQITVRVEGHKIILDGTVQSWAEKKQAVKAAWSAKGITNVEDNLKIKIREFV